MAAQALYRRWRPQTFDDVVGQQHIVKTLRNAVRLDRLAQAYLFTGPRGTGKTSVARILAKAVNCEEGGAESRPCGECSICEAIAQGRSLDLIEIDAASNTGVDDVRDLREKIGFAPNETRFKVYIIDEVHMLSTQAFNALLKTLEEPPAHALFVMATTEPHKIPDTILSRCQRHDFRRVDLTSVTEKLIRICEAEGADAQRSALEIIARNGTGSIRDAESLLDQLIATGETITPDLVRLSLGTPSEEAVADLVDAAIAGDAAAGLRTINEALDRGTDARQLQSQLIDHLRSVLMLQTGLDASLLNQTDAGLQRMQAQAQSLNTTALVKTIHRFNGAPASANRALPALPLELALVETVLALQGQTTLPTATQVPASTAASSAVSNIASKEVAKSATRPKPATSKAGTGTSNAPEPKKSPTRATNAPSSAPKDSASESSARETSTAPDDVSDVAVSTEVAADAGDAVQGGAAATSSDKSSLLAELVVAWDAVLDQVGAKDRNVVALLKDCRPVSVSQTQVVLGFFYEFHSQRASQKDRAALIESALSTVLGRPIRLQTTVVEEGEADKATRPRSKTDKARQDPVIKHAVEALGATISTVKDSPPMEDEAQDNTGE